MDSILGKFILITASVLGILGGPNYIQVTESQLDFNFKTGGNFPIYYFLNVVNIGPQKARLDVSSDTSWLFVYREGLQNQTTLVSLELPQNSPLNFVLEVHPERLNDGVHKAKVTVKAVNLQDYSVMDSKEVMITLNKNVVQSPSLPILSPTPLVVTETPSASPIVSPSEETPLLTPTKTPSLKTSIPKTLSPLPTILPSSKTTPIIRPFKVLIESLRNLLRFFGL